MVPNDAITRCRVAAGLSYEDVACRLGMDRRKWWRMETGRIRIPANEMPRIAKALDATVSDLFGDRGIESAAQAAVAVLRATNALVRFESDGTISVKANGKKRRRATLVLAALALEAALRGAGRR